jgi:hypothetical protein
MMIYSKILLLFAVFLLSSCIEIVKKERDIKPEVEFKVFRAIKCDSNADIISVHISSLSKDLSTENLYTFSGIYKAKLLVKYEDDVRGTAIYDGDKIVIQSVTYESHIVNGEVSGACLNP